jgi:hypothetical protein
VITWLLGCPLEQKLLEWTKEKHSNILVVFIFATSTNGFQPIDVIM